MALDKRNFEREGIEYTVRFFDEDSDKDLQDLKNIVNTPGVKKWMTSVHGMKHMHFRQWMAEQGKNNEFLFAVDDGKTVHGFVYIYPSELIRGRLEVSYAKGAGSPSGLTTPALVNSCRIVRDHIFSKRPNKKNPPMIIAEIEEDNIPSIKVVEKAGFEMIRKFDKDDNGVWMLNWENI